MVVTGPATSQQSSFIERFKLADLPLFLFFAACLIPLNVQMFSVNYLFVLLPAWCLLSGKKFRLPPKGLLVALGWYVLIFVAGVVFDLTSGQGFNMRAAISFVIFLSMFALVFFDISERDLLLFKTALIALALVYSLFAVVGFFTAGGNSVGFAQKDIVGSQRYGFVYLTAFCIAISKKADLGLSVPVKFMIVTILLAGMLLTFSRSTVVTFVATGTVYAFFTVFERRRSLLGGLADIGRRFAVVLSSLAVLFIVMPLPFNFYTQQILVRYVPVARDMIMQHMLKAPEIVDDVFNSAGSEGTRWRLWSLILDHVNRNPILGSRYKGMWSIEGAPSGSAHNQLLDVLLRTGWPGLAIYVLILVRLLLCLYRVDRGLFWALMATLVFGLFHETFKESQGAFILAFFLAILATSTREGILRPSSILSSQS